MSKAGLRLETKLIHAGEPNPRIEGAVNVPIFQSAMFEFAGETSYHDLKYIRLNNTPNHVALHGKIAALENAEAALVTGSGMAAISSTILTVLSTGDHLLVLDTLYGGTHGFVTHELESFGMEYTWIDGDDPDSWEAARRPETKAIYMESVTNPLLQVPDHEAVVRFAKANDLLSLVDNTVPSPVNFRPLEWGYDLSIHSCTKYMNGHSDIVAGAIAGSSRWIKRITRRLNHLGGSLDPNACFLLHRGLKTLAVRMRQHNASTMEVARFLEGHPAVANVNYPGLESHPRHERASKLFDGFSGMLSFELNGGAEAAKRFIKKTTLACIAPSFGGTETIITRPVTTSHSGIPAEDLERVGIGEGLVRVSIGLEATEDLIADFRQALES